MHWTLRLGTALATLTLPANALAQATASPCLTEAEATAFFSYALPEMLDTVAGKCIEALPTSSFLSTNSKALVSKYRAASAPDWPQAKAAFLKLGGDENSDGTKILKAMPDETLKVLVSTGFNVVVGKEIKPVDCPKIDAVVSSLAPLPISNIAKLLVSMGGLAGKKPDDAFKICPNS
jgi:hypothetical protein